MTGSMEIYPEQREFLEIELPDTVMLILVSVQSGFTEKIPAGAVPEELYKMTLEKIMRNLIGEYKPVYVFMNRYQDAVGMIGGYKGETENLQEIISDSRWKMLCPDTDL